jgi:hypothetical protein
MKMLYKIIVTALLLSSALLWLLERPKADPQKQDGLHQPLLRIEASCASVS